MWQFFCNDNFTKTIFYHKTKIMNHNEKLTELLNNLIVINNDRIKGYEKAIQDVGDTDVDLKKLFTTMAQNSQQHKAQLMDKVNGAEEQINDNGSSVSASIYRTWMDIKSSFSGHERRTILEICKDGEDAALEAYGKALAEQSLPADLRELLTAQKESLETDSSALRKLISEN